MPFRIGIGFDVHPFVENRKLVLGGVEIPFSKGLKGHSDADVLTHALCDALLGAVALGDLGSHFPDTDDHYKGISSIELLKKVNQLLLKTKFEIENVDGVVVAQQPVLSPYIPEMRKKLADTLHIPVENLSVKATTTEYLGFTGRKEGIAAIVNVLVRQSGSR
ncbi:2-C-methyl-D-erythritol 2,4-cyclodiphosphate synthase [Candidatus Sulfidibacterium hydrothermale]|uniref:2-C-methyl-D-erythritol 2,4-cyclodiphosphate synthase n=1 Tax=Candidatus Sulfidibacterium hydrothermale TaxID=2875962 RepID=UPI001F0A591E|nr:2-C-methyl-D-erythritol 2,4-cyclodiphosphate synthase [Candidatus Sulfidibacterium hydrothermale]UBM62008.1 2-C-methyl-D-erythritol 2,4-cyclodiphosphate synthase [Candidatus Sulfidibacterium hydrothermale]